MTRRIRLCSRRTAVYTALAVAVCTDAASVIVRAIQDRTTAALDVGIVFAVLGFVAVCGALSAAWHLGRAIAQDKWSRRQQLRSARMRAAEEIKAYWGPVADGGRQHAEAMAELAAEHAQPLTVGYTAVMPVVQTAPTWGFSPHGAGVIEPPQESWTAPVSAPLPVTTGRHAGAAADGLAEWGAHEVGGVR